MRGAEVANILWAATTRFIEMADAELAMFQLTMERLIVLREIAVAHGPVDMKSLARRLSVSPATISEHVRRLKLSSHVEHIPDAFDRRVKVVKATVKGLYIAALASAVVAGGTNRLAAGLSNRDRNALVRALERFAATPRRATSRAST